MHIGLHTQPPFHLLLKESFDILENALNDFVAKKKINTTYVSTLLWVSKTTSRQTHCIALFSINSLLRQVSTTLGQETVSSV